MKGFRPKLIQLSVLGAVVLGLSVGTSSARRSTVTNPSQTVVLNPTPVVVSAP